MNNLPFFSGIYPLCIVSSLLYNKIVKGMTWENLVRQRPEWMPALEPPMFNDESTRNTKDESTKKSNAESTRKSNDESTRKTKDATTTSSSRP